MVTFPLAPEDVTQLSSILLRRIALVSPDVPDGEDLAERLTRAGRDYRGRVAPLSMRDLETTVRQLRERQAQR